MSLNTSHIVAFGFAYNHFSPLTPPLDALLSLSVLLNPSRFIAEPPPFLSLSNTLPDSFLAPRLFVINSVDSPRRSSLHSFPKLRGLRAALQFLPFFLNKPWPRRQDYSVDVRSLPKDAIHFCLFFAGSTRTFVT